MSAMMKAIVVRTPPAAACLACALLVLAPRPCRADETDWPALEQAYVGEVRPLLARYCHQCHGADLAEADVDLAAFAVLADVRKQPRTWQKAREMLDNGQMPPPGADQPTDAERARIKQWVRGYLSLEARARAGDPGRVVLRRLSNAEYTYSLRDLTGIGTLEPAREFPVDGAAGEGFTNAGAALVMSPALITKYLDAAKEVAGHLVLLPDGIRFSPHTSRRDWTDEQLAAIRDFYARFTDASGGTRINLQGIISDTNTGGRLPVEKYLAALLAEREALAGGGESIAEAATKHGLNAKYLGTLWTALNSPEASLLLDGLRARWREAGPGDAAALAAYVAAWQNELWKFTTVGHIGKVGGPKAWLEPVNPLAARQDVRIKIPATLDGGEVVVTFAAGDAGDSHEHDVVVWEQPRLVAPGRADLPLRGVRQVARDLAARRQRVFADAAKFLAAADEAADRQGTVDLAGLAAKHAVDVDDLRAWLDYLGVGTGAAKIEGHFTAKITGASGYDFIRGWGQDATPLVVANSSNQHVRIPGNMKPHSVAVHPSPTRRAVIGWRSPVSATVRVSANTTHAHPECGNGVTWSLDLRRGATRQRLASGIAQGNAPAAAGPIENLAVQTGDVVSLVVGPRDGNHSCDLTAIDLEIVSSDDQPQTWNLAADVSDDIHAGNPHADRFGNKAVWHFYTEPDNREGQIGPVIPAGSLLAKWQTAQGSDTKRLIAEEVQQLLASGPPADKQSPDAALYRQLASLGGPLFSGRRRNSAGEMGESVAPQSAGESSSAVDNAELGPDPSLFGKHPLGSAIDSASLCVRAPAVVEMRLPADLVAGCELVTTGVLDADGAVEGSVQLRVVAAQQPAMPAFEPGTPILTREGSAARRRFEAAFDDFRQLFPAALCYTRIVPVDEVVTLTLFYREDDQLARLMLDDDQKRQLDRLWSELRYISQDALTLVDAFAQLMEYATQDADPKVFEPLRQPINDRAAAFRQGLVDTEPRHLDALMEFARRAYRRPLTEIDERELRGLYALLRRQDIGHDEALRLTLARILVSPAFLYRIEKPGPAAERVAVNDWELASRLSYFLWSSLADDELRQAATAGRLQETEALLAQTRRMLRDGRTRRLATEFACQWLHIRDFDHLDEKSERHFPTFAGLRGAMYEESIRFFTDLFQNNGSVLDILDADYMFLNDELARHYALPAGQSATGDAGSAWRRIDGVKQFGRGGILAQATILATQSGASRTSPILRGNWISEVLLGERLPRPPKDVPRLPEDETATDGLTVRQLVEKHSSDARCAVCHQRIDAFGFALERFDAIGRRRDKDLGERPIDTRVRTMDGAEFDGLDGLRSYLLSVRRDAFVRQFCRKLLGYALGRATQLSDEPLLDEMHDELKARQYQVAAAIEAIVRCRQFRDIRGSLAADED